MKVKKFKTQWNSDEFPPGHAIVRDSVSLTIPDQSLTVRQIQTRYAQGLPLDVKAGIYETDEDGNGQDELLPDVSKLDRADRMLFLEQVKNNITELRQILKEEDAAQKVREAKEKAHQGPKVQRTTGEEADQWEEDQPDPNILKKPGVQGQRPATKRKEAEG